MSTPTPNDYRLRPTEIDHSGSRCMARHLAPECMDKRFTPHAYPEFQCNKKPMPGSDLCKQCTTNLLKRGKTAKDDNAWNSRVTEEPPAWSHVLGTTAMAHCKFNPDKVDKHGNQFGYNWHLFTTRLASRAVAPVSSSNAAPTADPEPIPSPDTKTPNIGETVYCSFGRGAAKHEYSATFSFHPKNGTRLFTVIPDRQPKVWGDLPTEFPSPTAFASTCQMLHKGSNKRESIRGPEVCYVKRGGNKIVLNDLPALPQLIVTERDEIDVLRAQNASLEARIAALEAQVAALGASNATKDAKLTAIRAAFDV
jgi:hypothetical protein